VNAPSRVARNVAGSSANGAAAALRGFANAGSPAASRSSFMRVNAASGMKISRTSSEAGGLFRRKQSRE
jgi:hypothetical protein